MGCGEIKGASQAGSRELRRAKHGIQGLEIEGENLRRANAMLDRSPQLPKRSTRCPALLLTPGFQSRTAARFWESQATVTTHTSGDPYHPQ